ncbi:MAG: hypothetical protein KBC73_18630 [Burkholderiaceae bacterium]|nr:hypothetical protein [Burkholderiaceae bacterium]
MRAAVVVPVLHDAPAVLVGIEAGECNLFKIVEDRVDFLRGRFVFTRPADHSRGVSMHRF